MNADEHGLPKTQMLPLKAVIAGLDPAIRESRMNAADFAHRLDCRVKPGNDSFGDSERAHARCPFDQSGRHYA
jgi:hypothetical protein